MKITIIGSHLCPDTLYALNKLTDRKAGVDFKNLSADLKDLKAYLAARESEPVYEAVKRNGGIGIPFFILEDGTKTLDLDEVLEKL
ncbi:glutaredoxin [Lacrimispora sp.]|uniref:glutaredoxin n=1 Tax=Lacrimispora sp. TaxID=2719234 RepID=UPI0028AAEF2F|nr:glutaredoxin [Lacrimispora sp.]